MQHISVARGLGTVSAVILLVTLVAGCYTSPLEEARKQVPVGTLRDDAIQVLTEKAWYHQSCPNLVGSKLETITDLFFLGSHKYDQADIVIAKSRPVNGVFVVDDDLGSFEPYVWHAVYKDCLQREQFED